MTQRESISEFAQLENEEQPTEGHGTVVWFNPDKGYGFIRPDEAELPDIYMYVDCLKAAGYSSVVYLGTRVIYEAQRVPRGLAVKRLISVDESASENWPERQPASIERAKAWAESTWEDAEVKWFDYVRGYGFLTRGKGTRDIFVHNETLKRCGVGNLTPGKSVRVRWIEDKKGPVAKELL